MLQSKWIITVLTALSLTIVGGDLAFAKSKKKNKGAGVSTHQVKPGVPKVWT